MTPKRFESDIGIGATDEFSLRVSVAALVRVLFEHPKNGELMLALEHKATLLEKEGDRFVDVKAQPFGGAIQIHDPRALQDLIGDFHFDCEQSRSERDFRIFIRPSAWETIRRFCLQHFRQANDSVLESNPGRELVEEFDDALKIRLELDQFNHHAVGLISEEHPSPAENVYVRGWPTVRIYRIFESRILDTSLVNAIVMNSKNQSSQLLRELALEDAQRGGPGWANAVLTLPLKQINEFYLATSPENRNRPILFQEYRLDETVAAILENIPVPKYQRDVHG